MIGTRARRLHTFHSRAARDDRSAAREIAPESLDRSARASCPMSKA